MYSMNAKKRTILVTGGLGHIGSRLIRELDPKLIGRVIIVDNLLTQRYASLFDLSDTYTYQFYQDDIRTADIARYLKGVYAVVHLAAITDAESSKGRKAEVEAVNLEGLKRVADACAKANVRLLFPSTTSVYGSQEKRVNEDCTELAPQSPYAESKLAAEKYLAKSKSKNQNFKFVTCRFGTIFGWSVGMRFHTAVNKFIWQAVNRLPVPVWKTAWKQHRPYLDLSDCVRAINFILKNDLFDGNTYNVLTSNYTVQDVVETIRQFVPKLEVSYVDSRIMNQLSYDVDDSRFRARGFTPRGNLKKGIHDTIKHLKAIQ